MTEHATLPNDAESVAPDLSNLLPRRRKDKPEGAWPEYAPEYVVLSLPTWLAHPRGDSWFFTFRSERAPDLTDGFFDFMPPLGALVPGNRFELACQNHDQDTTISSYQIIRTEILYTGDSICLVVEVRPSSWLLTLALFLGSQCAQIVHDVRYRHVHWISMLPHRARKFFTVLTEGLP